VVVLDVDADELAEDDEEHGALQERPDERPEEAEDGILVSELQLTEREKIQQFPRSSNLPVDTLTPVASMP
jgi:hypothetical protein